MHIFHLFPAVTTVLAASSEQWASRSIYQIVTDRFAVADGSSPTCNIGERKYCGGTWAGIKNKLPYIRGMGFDAILMSPVVENFDELSQYGEAYHGYWTHNINRLNNHFGTSQDLKDLVDAVHAADMYIMVDMTVNSMAWPGAHDAVDYSKFTTPFNTRDAFHPFCWIDFNDPTITTDTITDCWLGDDNVALVDVATEKPAIQSTYQTWIKNLIAEYGFDGIRIDALKHVNIEFFRDFVREAGVFALGENFQADPDLCCKYQTYVPGLLNYPVYYGVYYAFNGTGGGMQNLVNLMRDVEGNCSIGQLANFIENHDLERYAGITTDQHQRINALAFSFLNDGIPVVYYGQEQAFTGAQDPYNREALWISAYNELNPYYTTIATLSAVRRNAIAADATFTEQKATVLKHDTDYLALKKGHILSLLFNDGIWGSNETITIESTGYQADTMLIEAMSHNMTKTDAHGTLRVRRNSGAPMIFVPYDEWKETIPKPNTNVEIDTRTTATTTMTTTYVYPTAKPATGALSRSQAQTNAPGLVLTLTLIFMGFAALSVL